MLPVILLLLVLTGSGWFALKHGITLDRVVFGSATVSGLSLRLDQGFIVTIDRLAVRQSPGKNASGRFAGRIARLGKWSSFLHSVTIKELVYRGHSASVTYQNGRLLAQGDDLRLTGSISTGGKSVRLGIETLEIRPAHVVLKGEGTFKTDDNRFDFSGSFQSNWGKGSVTIEGQGEEVNVRLSTEPFTDLAALLHQLHLDPDAAAWVTENISAESYRIEELLLQLNLTELDNPNPDSIRGTAMADSAAIRFQPALPPVECDKIAITYQDDRLSFNLAKPTYREKDLAGSRVTIAPLLGAKTRLIIHLRTESALDRDILEILAGYDLELPFRQNSGTAQTDLTLSFDLPEFSLNTSGTFHTGSGQWQWGDNLFQVQEAALAFHNKKIRIEKAGISYDDAIKTKISGSVDLDARKAALTLNIDKLDYQAAGTTLLRAADNTMPLTIDYSREPVVVSLDQLGATILLSADSSEITAGSVPALQPFVPFLRALPITGGRLHAVLQDIDHIRFDGEAEIPNNALSLDNKPIKRFRFHGQRNNGQTDILINDGRISAILNDTLSVELQDYLVTVDTADFTGKGSGLLPIALDLTGPATRITARDFQVATGKFTLKTSGADLTFDAQMEQGTFSYTSTPGEQQFTGRDLDAALAADFFPNMDMTKGLIDVVLHGTTADFEGYLELRNIHVKNTEILHNLLAFINTVPALATFSSPGFDSEGYLIRDGVIYFAYRDPILTIRRMHTDGTTVNIEMQGWINTKKRTVNLDAELITLKDYSKIISKIPLAGYAILDEDGSLSTSLKMTGDLDAPDIKTNLARDILFTPLNVIKRTVQWPFRLLGKAVNGEKEVSEPVKTGPDKSLDAGGQ